MQHTSTPSLQQALFPLTPKQLSSAGGEFDIIVVGSGFGGGVLAADLVEKLSKIPAASSPSPAKDPAAERPSPKRKNSSSPDRLLSSTISSSPRILLIERGAVPFATHCSNVPALASVPAHRTFKSEWAVESKDVQWQGGAVFALGGRSAVWNGRAERLSSAALSKLPSAVAQDLREKYYQRAEQILRVTQPSTGAAAAVTSELNSYTSSMTWEPVRLASSSYKSGSAFSTVDPLLTAATAATTSADERFRILLNTKVERLEVPPTASGSSKAPTLAGVIVRGPDGVEYTLRARKVVLSAGTVETAAISLRTAAPPGSTSPSPTSGLASGVFGHLTVQRAYTVSMPFVPRDLNAGERLYGTQLRSRMTLDGVSGASADVELSLSGPASSNAFPTFRMTFTLPSDIVSGNSIVLNAQREPVLRIEYAADSGLEAKRRAMVELAAQSMNRLGASYDLIFLKSTIPLAIISLSDIPLVDAVAEYRAVEVGTAPMGDVVDSDLRLKTSIFNSSVYICDASVLPFSPSSPPALTLAALALRLSDHLLPLSAIAPQPQPITVWNFTKDPVWVTMSLSFPSDPSYGGSSGGGGMKIKSGAKETWGRVPGRREVITVKASLNAPGYSVMEVAAGKSVWITKAPPP